MLILGIDPGYAIVGFGVVRYAAPRFAPVEYGAILTEPSQSFGERLDTIYRRTCEVIERRKPDVMAIERLYYTSNAKTVIMVAEARGVILLAAQHHDLPIREYTPLQVKKAVTGHGQALKSQVEEMTRRMLCLPQVPKPDDTADALAIAICHAHHRQVNR